jgi:hypothetical protein
MGHGALWFAPGRISKSLLGFLVLEGVEERDALLNRGLRFRSATRGKTHFAKLVRRRGRQGVRAGRCGLKSEKIAEQANS